MSVGEGECERWEVSLPERAVHVKDYALEAGGAGRGAVEGCEAFG